MPQNCWGVPCFQDERHCCNVTVERISQKAQWTAFAPIESISYRPLCNKKINKADINTLTTVSLVMNTSTGPQGPFWIGISWQALVLFFFWCNIFNQRHGSARLLLIWKQTAFAKFSHVRLPDHWAPSRCPSVVRNTQLPPRTFPTLSMCFPSYHWPSLLPTCLQECYKEKQKLWNKFPFWVRELHLKAEVPVAAPNMTYCADTERRETGRGGRHHLVST